jgi:nucleoside 2-deoxyribosyltransferase
MRVYLAARYSRKLELRKYREELRARGIEVTSHWLDEEDSPESQLTPERNTQTYEHRCRIARRDMLDIASADVLVNFCEEATTPIVRGGHIWESGFAYALQLYSNGQYKVVHVGPRQNIFAYLPDVHHCADWEEAKCLLDGWRVPTYSGHSHQLGFGFDYACPTT